MTQAYTAILSERNPPPVAECINVSPEKRFTSSDTFAHNRIVRQQVGKAKNLTRAERDITLSIVSLWFTHRGHDDSGIIRPGRKYLAKKVRCSVRTVASTLDKLRKAGALQIVAYAKGGRRATQYRVDLETLMKWAGAKLPEVIKGPLRLLKRNFKLPSWMTQKRAISAHGNNNRSTSNTFFPSEWFERCPPMPNWPGELADV
jgi:hypothetical protein